MNTLNKGSSLGEPLNNIMFFVGDAEDFFPNMKLSEINNIYNYFAGKFKNLVYRKNPQKSLGLVGDNLTYFSNGTKM